MFSEVSVHRDAVPCDYYPWCIGPHCTGPLPCTEPWPPSVSDIWWPRLETFKFVPLRTSLYRPTNRCWHLVAGHWNMYSGRTGSTHPTRMLSCKLMLLKQWTKYSCLASFFNTVSVHFYPDSIGFGNYIETSFADFIVCKMTHSKEVTDMSHFIWMAKIWPLPQNSSSLTHSACQYHIAPALWETIPVSL